MKTIQDVMTEVKNFFEFTGNREYLPRVSEPYDPYDSEHCSCNLPGGSESGIYVLVDRDGRITHIGAAHLQDLGKSFWGGKYFGASNQCGHRVEYAWADEKKVPEGVHVYTIPLGKLGDDSKSRSQFILSLKRYLLDHVDPKDNRCKS